MAKKKKIKKPNGVVKTELGSLGCNNGLQQDKDKQVFPEAYTRGIRQALYIR